MGERADPNSPFHHKKIAIFLKLSDILKVTQRPIPTDYCDRSMIYVPMNSFAPDKMLQSFTSRPQSQN